MATSVAYPLIYVVEALPEQELPFLGEFGWPADGTPDRVTRLIRACGLRGFTSAAKKDLNPETQRAAYAYQPL